MTAIANPTTARLSHLLNDPLYKEEIPYEIWANKLSKDAERTNVKLNIVPDCALIDIRDLEGASQPQLESHGFQWFHQEFPVDAGLKGADDVSTATPEQREGLDRYLATMSTFIRDQLGCEKTICWDWRVCFFLYLAPSHLGRQTNRRRPF